MAGNYDHHARDLWGAAYDRIPKSVFATIAWHLANVASGQADVEGAAEGRFIREAVALGHNLILPLEHVQSVGRALDGRGSCECAYPLDRYGLCARCDVDPPGTEDS